MILDHTGTEYRGGRIRLSSDWVFRPKAPQWWEPQTEDIRHYVITAFVRVQGVPRVVWRGSIFDLTKALRFWESLHDGIGPTSREWDIPMPGWYPGLLQPGIEYHFATLLTYNSVGTTSWVNSASLQRNASWFVLAGGGGGGGSPSGGGGGSGDLRTGTGDLPGGTYTVTVGDGGNGDLPGANSVFGAVTSNGGGGGNPGGSGVGQNGGSGGGGGGQTGSAGGTATGVLGKNGGAGVTDGGTNRCSGGGGGLSAVGGAGQAVGDGYGGYGGAGVASAFFGASINIGGGGGGAIENGISNGLGASTYGGGTAGGPANGNPGTANTGGGGGGGGRGGGSSGTYTGGKGGSGKVGFSFTPPIRKNFNMPNLGL